MNKIVPVFDSASRLGACFAAAVATVLAVLLLAAPLARAGLGDLFGPQGDSGTGKVAKLAFRLDDSSFVPTTVVWSPDGRFIATSGVLTRTIHIWDVAQRKLVKQMELPNGPPPAMAHNLAWSPDGRWLAICNAYQTDLRIYATRDWSVARDFGVSEVMGCQKPVFSSDSQELTIWGGDLTTYATSDWHVIRRLKGVAWMNTRSGYRYAQTPDAWDAQLLLHDMAYVPGTHTLVFGGGRQEPNTDACGPLPEPYKPYAGRVWILQPGEKALTPAHSLVVYCPLHAGDVDLLAFSPDGKELATVTGTRDTPAGETPEGNAKVMSFPSGVVIGRPVAGIKASAPHALTFTPDGRYLLIDDGRAYVDKKLNPDGIAVHIVDAHTLRLLDTVHASPFIYDIAASPDSTMFAVAAGHGVTVWKFVQP